MDRHSLRDLEYHKILQALKGLTISPMGEEEVLSLRPTTSFEEIHLLLSETEELQSILSQEGDIPIHSIKDIRPILSYLSKGLPFLRPGEFLSLKKTLMAAEALHRFFEARKGVLKKKAESLPILSSLRRRIEETIDEEGSIKEDASPELKGIRQEMIRIKEQIRKLLEGILKRKGLERAFSNRMITMREGRYVLPVRKDFHHLLPGIVHDESHSGATYYIEPMESVDLNNRLTLLKKKCEEEERRILLGLTEEVRREVDSLQRMVKGLTSWEVLYAKARLGLLLKASRPSINREGRIHIRKAHHPLLILQGIKVVPIDIRLGEGNDLLVVSGANAGGKTVSLKTLGLLTLMVQSGLTIPVGEGSEVAIFERVLAHVGDDQSIEGSMSTFSAHVERLVEVLDRADSNSLVLIDEIGTGTDPAEGAALSLAILEALKEKGAKVVVTTHYPQLKAFAHREKRSENLSVEFDEATSRPTYRLIPGIPGASNALAIAKTFGMPEEVVERARFLLKDEDMGLTELISSLEEERERVLKEKEKVEALRTSLERLEKKRDEALKRLMERRNSILERSKIEAEKVLKAFREELARVLEEAKGEKERIEVMERRVEELYREHFHKRPKKGKGYRPAVGEVIYLPSLKERGEVRKVDEKGVEVDTGRFRFRVPFNEVEPLKREVCVTRRHGVSINLKEVPQGLPLKLNLRGQRVEEAIRNLERYIDRALLVGLERVEIIHGKGEGVLRGAVHEYLKGHPAVTSFGIDGMNDGVTEVILRG